jgi:hypothetical protein
MYNSEAMTTGVTVIEKSLGLEASGIGGEVRTRTDG